MAEVLGLVASVVAVLQLAEVIDKKVSGYLRTVKSAKSVLVPLLGKVRHLTTILKTLQVELESKNSSTLQYLVEPVEICGNLLTRIQSRLDNLKIIGGYAVGPLLDKESLKNLKQLDDLIPILQLAVDADTLMSSHAIVDYLQSLRLETSEQFELLHDDVQAYHDDARRWKQEADNKNESAAQCQLRESIFNWLTVVDPDKNYLAACERNQPGTGNWLLNNATFADWERGKTRYLWINAIAGAGKTILSSTIIRYLVSKYDSTCVNYYFFDFKDTSKQDVKNLLGSLLVQAAGPLRDIPEPLLQLFQRHKLQSPERPTSPVTDELLEALIELLNSGSTKFIVIDALDECKEIQLLLESICAIFERLDPNCRIVLTSRAENEIQRVIEKQNVQCLQIQGNDVDRDVALYVRAVLESDGRLNAHRQVIKDLITDALTDGAKGMFRWVQCQIDHIKTLRTAKEVKNALKQLPPTLDQTYDRIFALVQSTDEDLLRRALELVVFSARPLRLEEVAEAVVVQPGISEIDEDDRLQRPEDILEIGKSLFVQSKSLESGSQLLELSHYSVKEYLLSDRIKKGPAAIYAINEAAAELNNATCLMTYLGLEVFEAKWTAFNARIQKPSEEGGIRVEAELIAREHGQVLRDYPLLCYAAQHCLGRHCQSETVQEKLSPLACDLFGSPTSGRFQYMTYTCVYNSNDLVASLERLFRYSFLNIAARFNLTVFIGDLLAAGVSVDNLPLKPPGIKRHPEGQTALYRAADFGHVDLCKLLIEAGANVQGSNDYDCPLSAACRSGKVEIVRLMLDAGVDVLRDAVPLAETQLTIWWRYVEEKNSAKWKGILESIRVAEVRWSTVTLLSAFSKIIRPLVPDSTEILSFLAIEDVEAIFSLLDNLIITMEPITLLALQWLVQDKAGTSGIQASLKRLLRASFENRPQLFNPISVSMTQKYTPEEMIAENLIHLYFRPAMIAGELRQRSKTDGVDAVLNRLWDNKDQANTTIKPDPGATTASASAYTNADDVEVSEIARSKGKESFIVCGEILQAWNRGRWDDAYSHFFD